MAVLATSAVTVNRSFREGGHSGKDNLIQQLTLVLTGQGGATNTIDAATLGLKKIESCSNAITSAGAIILAAPSYDGTVLLLAATDATAGAVSDQTATIRLRVIGYD
jgi:hypothetical protein